MINLKIEFCTFYTLLVIFNLFSFINCKGLQDVTCGSVFKLYNSGYKVRLHSHDIKYGSGSGQQSVTGTEIKEDVNSMWQIKGTSKFPCKRGEPVNCGSKIRLEHSTTKKNLHSHHFSAPLSGHQEISAFGDNGEGDTGDSWEVVCNDVTWNRDSPVQFRHLDTDVYLGISGNTFGRPISGQMEIVGLPYTDASSSSWIVKEGVFISPSESSDKGLHHEHNEL